MPRLITYRPLNGLERGSPIEGYPLSLLGVEGFIAHMVPVEERTDRRFKRWQIAHSKLGIRVSPAVIPLPTRKKCIEETEKYIRSCKSKRELERLTDTEFLELCVEENYVKFTLLAFKGRG